MSKNILIIDDEPLVTRSLQRLLKRQGYNAIVASSAKEALEKLKDIEPDLIVSDVRMPGTDGIEAIKEIREQLKKSNKAQVPEILITGYADDDYHRQAQDLEVADYIYKPFDIKDLLDAIKRNLQ